MSRFMAAVCVALLVLSATAVPITAATVSSTVAGAPAFSFEPPAAASGLREPAVMLLIGSALAAIAIIGRKRLG